MDASPGLSGPPAPCRIRSRSRQSSEDSNLAVSFESCVLIAFVPGVAQGSDPGPLAALDGLTRFNAILEASRARYCGLLFSPGHGVVVMAVAVLVGAAFVVSLVRGRPPAARNVRT